MPNIKASDYTYTTKPGQIYSYQMPGLAVKVVPIDYEHYVCSGCKGTGLGENESPLGHKNCKLCLGKGIAAIAYEDFLPEIEYEQALEIRRLKKKVAELQPTESPFNVMKFEAPKIMSNQTSTENQIINDEYKSRVDKIIKCMSNITGKIKYE
jgi:hypothetical protein